MLDENEELSGDGTQIELTGEDEGGELEAPEISIEIEGEQEEEEPELIRHLRREVREAKRELANATRASAPSADIEVGPRPTLEGCDWDDQKFEEQLEAWQDRKRQKQDAERAAQDQQAQAGEQNQKIIDAYRAKVAKLGVNDFDQAEAKVRAALPDVLQSAILQYAKNPEKVVYALGKYPAKLEQLASETDVVRAILAINDLERNLKVVRRRNPPPPEADSIQSSSASLTQTPDKEIEALYKKGEKTGDFSEYFRRQREMRKKQA